MEFCRYLDLYSFYKFIMSVTKNKKFVKFCTLCFSVTIVYICGASLGYEEKPKVSSQIIDLTTNCSSSRKSSPIHIGILIPTTTRKLKVQQWQNLSLFTLCIPSIVSTLEHKYQYTIYIGIDKGDMLEKYTDDISKKYPLVKPVIVDSHTFTRTVNGLAKVAYYDMMDYFVRVNDDTVFKTYNWTTLGINTLTSYAPPNVGVVGPTCHEGKTTILTHDMVHRSHIEIFRYYYPPVFDNSCSDEWMTEVYKPRTSTKLTDWVVYHSMVYGTRYRVDFKKRDILKDRKRIKRDCFLIRNYKPICK